MWAVAAPEMTAINLDVVCEKDGEEDEHGWYERTVETIRHELVQLIINRVRKTFEYDYHVHCL